MGNQCNITNPEPSSCSTTMPKEPSILMPSTPITSIPSTPITSKIPAIISRPSSLLPPPSFLSAPSPRTPIYSAEDSKSNSDLNETSMIKPKLKKTNNSLSRSIRKLKINLNSNTVKKQRKNTHTPLYESTYEHVEHKFSNPNTPKPSNTNGITGVYISQRVVKLAAQFWNKNISNEPLQNKLVCDIILYVVNEICTNNINIYIQNRRLVAQCILQCWYQIKKWNTF